MKSYRLASVKCGLVLAATLWFASAMISEHVSASGLFIPPRPVAKVSVSPSPSTSASPCPEGSDCSGQSGGNGQG